jgi:pyruvate, orthophosphate dikinase
MTKKEKYIYHFGNNKAEGNVKMKDLLGGKGANLAEMTNTQVPVPPGFTITTTMCNLFHKNNCKFPGSFKEDLSKAIKTLEKTTNKKFDDKENPLLVSVRSGARISMPGMMDTVLNLGLNDKTVIALAEKSKNEKFAYDSYRRFLTMFGDVVLEIKREFFEKALQAKKDTLKVKYDKDLTTEALKELVEEYKIIIKSKSGKPFPQKIENQLDLTIKAVFNSWQNKRAITYRELNNIPHDLGTAVHVQAMVFGNFSENSATGVGFTRNPSTGKKEFYGEYLTNAQGEDVVAGIRTPKELIALKKEMPKAYKELNTVTTKLEKKYKDMQDFEFTIEEGKLFMLQTRTGKRSASAAIKIAMDMIKEKLITKQETILRIETEKMNELLHPIIDPQAKYEILTKGLKGAPGAAVGQVVFDPDVAVELNEHGQSVILVRTETSPDDINGMNAAKGVLTARGGMTSHAAVVARGMGKCCVVGCEEIKVNENSFTVNNIEIQKND